ncbi:MAG TPA: hypothetical protein VGL68_06995 [Solirubrobacteraceae bacterium]|jgi:hypothetical protein
MRAIPLKPEYGPTLGRMLAPRWHAASSVARTVAIVCGAGLLVLLVAAALTLEDAKYSHGGPVPFSFDYRDLYRTAPDPSGYVEVQRRSPAGRLEYSFAVSPLQLPAYRGALSGELPLYASGYIRALRRRYAGFVLRGEGKTRVNKVPAYDVLYTALVAGHEMYGRDVLLLPEGEGVRSGVDIAMLEYKATSSQVDSPVEAGGSGVLATPLKSFSLG